MIKIIKKNEKPELKFKCNVCKTEWKTDKWKVAEINSSYSGIMFMPSNSYEKPMSRCPVCNMQSYN